MSEVKYAIAILKEKLANADQHNLAYQRLSIADMEAIWGALEKSDKSYAEIKAQRDALAAIVQRVIDTGELARPEHESLEAELCALAASDGQTSCDARQDFEALIMLISRGLADVEKGINGYHDPQIQAFWENYQFSKDIRAGEPS